MGYFDEIPFAILAEISLPSAHPAIPSCTSVRLALLLHPAILHYRVLLFTPACLSAPAACSHMPWHDTPRHVMSPSLNSCPARPLLYGSLLCSLSSPLFPLICPPPFSPLRESLFASQILFFSALVSPLFVSHRIASPLFSYLLFLFCHSLPPLLLSSRLLFSFDICLLVSSYLLASSMFAFSPLPRLFPHLFLLSSFQSFSCPLLLHSLISSSLLAV